MRGLLPANHAATSWLALLVLVLLAAPHCCRCGYDVVAIGRNWTNVAATPLPGTHQHTLCLIAIVKNEGPIIDEWVQHYLWQGVDHIFVIDNNSTDNTAAVLLSYASGGTVSYFFRPERHRQTIYYNEVYQQHARGQCAWVLLVDADEYVYHRQPRSTLQAYVRSLDASRVAWVHMRWRMFGSSGHIQQPRSVRAAFLWRKEGPSGHGGKLIANTRFTVRVDIHHVNIEPPGLVDTRSVIPSTDSAAEADLLQGARMVFVREPAELALNHYAIMSREYFRRHKMTRGSARWSRLDNVRSMEYFQKYDHKEVLDPELSTMVNCTSRR